MAGLTFESEGLTWAVWAIHHTEQNGIPITRPRCFGVIQDAGFGQYSATCELCGGVTGYGLDLGRTYSSRNGARAALTRHYRKVHAEAVR